MKKNNKIKDINEYKKQKKNTHKNRRNRKIKKIILIPSMIIATSIVLIINIGGYAVVSELKYDIHYLKQDLRKEEIKLGEVRENLSQVKSIKEIELKAKEELNMDYPTKDQIRHIQVNE